MQVVSIQANLAWQAVRDPKSKFWIAICEPLKLTVQGETWRDLLESISDTLDLLVRELRHTGDLERFLGEHGWKLTAVPKPSANVRFDIPFKVERKRKYDTEAAVC